jgi:hypothetical protein
MHAPAMLLHNARGNRLQAILPPRGEHQVEAFRRKHLGERLADP